MPFRLHARGPLLVMALALTGTASLAAQTQFRVEPKASLAWWQIAPNMKHLWATTCPEEPSWQPGDVYSVGFVPKFTYEISSTDTLVPLYPRYTATAVCTPAITGQISVGDTTSFRDVRGLISIRSDAIVTGSRQRDTFAHDRVMESAQYPDIRFQIDSLTHVKGRLGPRDTLSADAVGQLEFHGVKRAWIFPIRAWHEKLGIRVTGQSSWPASDLVKQWNISRFPLNLGVGMAIWRTFYLGLDAVLVGDNASASANRPS